MVLYNIRQSSALRGSPKTLPNDVKRTRADSQRLQQWIFQRQIKRDIPCYKERTPFIRLWHTVTDLEIWIQMIISSRENNKGRLLIPTSNWSLELYNLLSLKLTLPVFQARTVVSLGSTQFHFGRKVKNTVCNNYLITLLTDVVKFRIC